MEFLYKIATVMQKTTIKILSFLFSTLIAYIINFKMLFLALGWAILFDLISGIFAYYKENGLIKQEYLIKSKLLKKTLEKGGGYLLIILMMAIFETHVFKVQFNIINQIVGTPMYGTGILTTICILIEYWSILENLKKGGIDLLGRSLGAYRFVQKYIKIFKNEDKSNRN